MLRSPHSELAKRINTAMSMLSQYSTTEEAVLDLMHQYGISRRQAYRYIQEAQKARHELPIPEEKVVFTVKIPKSLVLYIRRFAKSTGDSLSSIVAKALKLFLKRSGYV